MKKGMKQLLSMALAASMVVSLPMSALAEDGGADSGDTLVASVTGLEQKFSPFFAASVDDVNVTDMTQAYLLYTDRVGDRF
ncbi:MAG: hypothetical protein LUI13_05095 [Lachnospiraceae bacterium]|nr:hypothetical protein [Lachnospiraceae bacterium]